MADVDLTEQGKLLSIDQLAQVMQMLQNMKNNDQSNNVSEVTTSANCAGITLFPSPFSLNLQVDPTNYTRQTWIIDSGASEHISYNKDFFFNFEPLPKSICVNLPNSQRVEVSHSSSVKLFSNLIIHNVLFVPVFTSTCCLSICCANNFLRC